MTLTEIENEYSFKYSALYKQLEQDRILNVKRKENSSLLQH